MLVCMHFCTPPVPLRLSNVATNWQRCTAAALELYYICGDSHIYGEDTQVSIPLYCTVLEAIENTMANWLGKQCALSCPILKSLHVTGLLLPASSLLIAHANKLPQYHYHNEYNLRRSEFGTQFDFFGPQFKNSSCVCAAASRTWA
mgnify:CR=1 FL=1